MKFFSVFSLNAASMLRILTALFLAGLIHGCGTPAKQVNPQANSLDKVIFDRARLAFQSGNYKTAAAMLEPIAEKGNAEAQYSLGYLHYHGKGVEQNLKQAIKWFNLSAKQDNANAKLALSLIRKVTHNQQAKASAGTTVPPSGGSVIDLRTRRAQQAKPVRRIEPPKPERKQVQLPTGLPAPVIKTYTPPSTEENFIPPSERQSLSWILKQPSDYFTIQLASNTRKQPALRFIKSVALDGVYYFATRQGNEAKYSIIHGSFASFSQANKKLKRLRQRGHTGAWIRKMQTIQKLASQN